MIDMTDKVALVTGAGGGIGTATAEVFGSVGARVAVTDIAADNLAKTVDLLQGQGIEAEGFPCDITDRHAVFDVVGAVRSRFGRIDTLANIAGGSRTSKFLEQDPDNWPGEIAKNLFGTIYMSRAVLELDMFERRSGSIVNVASDAGRVGSLGEAVYSAAKGGVITFTKSLAREMSRHGIRVNCV